MRSIILVLVFTLVLPCYCYSVSLKKDMEDIMYLYEDKYAFEIAQEAPCRQWEALFIMGSVAIMYNCILFLDKDRCDLSILSVMIPFYFYYIDCLPLEPAP